MKGATARRAVATLRTVAVRVRVKGLGLGLGLDAVARIACFQPGRVARFGLGFGLGFGVRS